MRKNPWAVVLVVALVLAVLGGSLGLHYKALTLDEHAPKVVWDTLTALFLLSLMFERALEVLVRTFREPEAAKRRLKLDQAKREMDFFNSGDDKLLAEADRPARRTKLMEAQGEAFEAVEKHKTETLVVTSKVALVAGVLVAAVGFRVLEPLVHVSAGTLALGEQQADVLAGVDILLTGSLLAGGSKGIHTLADAVGEVLNRTAKGGKTS